MFKDSFSLPMQAECRLYSTCFLWDYLSKRGFTNQPPQRDSRIPRAYYENNHLKDRFLYKEGH